MWFLNKTSVTPTIYIYIINVVRLLFSLILLTIHLRPEITSTSRQRCIGPPSGSSQSSEIEKKNKLKQSLCRILSQNRHLKTLGLYIYNIYAHRYIYVCVYICIYIIYIYICLMSPFRTQPSFPAQLASLKSDLKWLPRPIPLKNFGKPGDANRLAA